MKRQQRQCQRARQQRKHLQLPAGIFLILACGALAGCSPRVVRVPLSQQDIIQANEAVQAGDAALSKNEHYPALIKYLEASRLNPNSEYIYNKLGVVYAQLKFYREAVEAFLHSIALNPKYPFSFNNLGSVYFARRDYRKAEKNFQKAIRLSENVASFHVNLGTLYFEMKKHNAAMVQLRRALQLDPDILKSAPGTNLPAEVAEGGSNYQKHYLMARLYASTGDAVRAVESLGKALAGGFDDWKALEKEPDFDPIRRHEGFIELMKFAQAAIGRPRP